MNQLYILLRRIWCAARNHPYGVTPDNYCKHCGYPLNWSPDCKNKR